MVWWTKPLFISQQFNSKEQEPVSCELKITQNNDQKIISRKQSDWKQCQNTKWMDPFQDLQGLEGVSIWLGGTSYNDNPIPVIELRKPDYSTLVSSHKLALYKPTILIEAGHHPNEISSMPAVQGLIKEIAQNRKELLDKVNLVVIPCANPDGAELHQKMTEDNPEWKHHAARFNAVGLEYTSMRYKKSIFGEADVVPNIVSRWLPDVVVDDHGIPSHEWVQPFAGYNSPPRFPQSYWVPISFIYGIARRLNKSLYPEHSEVLETIMKNITAKIEASTGVFKKNKYMVKRYEKYGYQWLPDVFPSEKTNQMIFYQWDTQVNPESPATISRYPEWCSIDLISEVADETVQGESLEQCIKAHQLFDLAVIETISDHKSTALHTGQNGYIEYSRKRPLNLRS